LRRTILHCDCNGFFASVECLLEPKLRLVPMAVAGDPENRHGIILAKNELAKKDGVKTAETIWQARRKCPGLVLVPPHHDLYQEYSIRVNKIYQRYTEQVEPFGIDESWLDVTGSQKLFGDGKKIADEIRAAVRQETGLTVSVGVSYNKVFAKLGSDYQKPDATTVFMPEDYEQKIAPLPVSDLLYVGKATQQTLNLIGIKTIGQLALADAGLLEQRLGKAGRMLHIYANGEDAEPVKSVYEQKQVKSVGNEITFREDLAGEEQLRPAVVLLADSVAARMRRHGFLCATVQVTVKDSNFKTVSRQCPVQPPTDLAREISEAALGLLKPFCHKKTPVRMLMITGSQLILKDQFAQQLSLFEDDTKKREKISRFEETLDGLHHRFGKAAVVRASTLNKKQERGQGTNEK
jgi:DNA polymerase-4